MELVPTFTPQDIHNERYVLGSILVDENLAMDEVVRFVTAESFALPQHRRIFEAMQAMYQRGERSLDIAAVVAELGRRGTLEAVGGADYVRLTVLDDPYFKPINVQGYANLVHRAHQLRTVREVGEEILRMATGARAQDADEIVEAAVRRLTETGAEMGGRNMADMFADKLLPRTFERIFERMEKAGDESGLPSGLPSGFPSLDRLTNGFNPSELIVVAARTGVGKTALVCNFALAVARAGLANWQRRKDSGQEVPQKPEKGVMIFSLEQADTELMQRMLCISAKLDGQKLLRGELDQQQQFELTDATNTIAPMSLAVDGSPRQTVSSIASLAKRAKRTYGIGMIVIDYLGLIESESKNLDRHLQVAEMTRRLKVLAKELQIPVMLLAQLSRSPAQREDKRPRLTDLRESGAIEQDADSVLFIHRPSEFDEKDRPGEVDLIVAKNRAGPKGTIPLVWMPHCVKFGEKAPEQEYSANF
ncbi:replicative DNA helicase [Planctomyces sp. SH-PL14]|uniref:replicative DNA helicase n=1 Tax=Planctomyces sp. SH-PL14 TaxID=1632864 RepID=UPI00078E4AB8|nr:replicative DNA helicase [Planctomyces sp. SH-PL14]AMV18237.1 Replicative DNA helicase [Planctomyces sp. SH-PL14]